MATTIGELFVNIGIKGAEKTVGALKAVGGFMGDLSSKGLAAKASIVGAIYALERLTEAGGKYGANLKNLGIYTGQSTKYIQQLREAFRESRVDVNEADQSLMGLQKALSETAITGQAPKGLATIFAETGGDINKMQDAAYSMGKIFQYIKKHKDDLEHTGIYNDLAESMGITPGAIITAKRFQGEVSGITKNVLSDKMVNKLDMVNGAWSDFWTKLSMFNNKMTADFGLPLVNGLNKILDKLLELEKNLERIYSKSKTFADVWKNIFGSKDDDKKTGVTVDPKTGAPDFSKLPSFSDILNKLSIPNRPVSEDKIKNAPSLIDLWGKAKSLDKMLSIPNRPLPTSPAGKPVGANTTNNTTVNMYGVENSHDGAEELKRHVNYALRQSPAQGWVA